MIQPRRTAYLLIAACCIGVGGLIFLNRAVIAKQLQDWQVIPQPERLSELYFTGHANLPQSLAAGSNYTVAFTVHNLEHQPITYHYKIVAESPSSNTEQPLGEGTFLLGHDKTQLSEAQVTVPTVEAEANVGIRVDLYYKNAETSETLQTQSIRHWAWTTLDAKKKAGP